MAPRVAHLLLTRFNVPHERYARDKRGEATRTAEWLEHRFSLFERFCLPSVRGARGADFEWLVFFDAATPAAARERIARHADSGAFRPVFAAHFDELVERVRAAVPAGTATLITSRLDNDDALARDTLAAVRRECRGQTLEFINPTTGYILSSGVIHRARLPRNPFLSLIESRPDSAWRTVWGVSHDRAPEVGPMRDLRERPYWLQVVHERNLVNAWGDRPLDALQPLKNRLKRALAGTGLLRRREGWIEPTRLTLDDLRAEFALER
jgi:hypothetical protein